MFIWYSQINRKCRQKYVYYNDWGIAFDGKDMWSLILLFWFGNDFARNVVIFDVDNTLSSHTNNQKNNVLVLGEGPTKAINDSICAAEKTTVNFSKAKTKFCLSLHYNDVKSFLYVNKIDLQIQGAW